MTTTFKAGDRVEITKDSRHRMVKKGAIGTVIGYETVCGQTMLAVRFPYVCRFAPKDGDTLGCLFSPTRPPLRLVAG